MAEFEAQRRMDGLLKLFVPTILMVVVGSVGWLLSDHLTLKEEVVTIKATHLDKDSASKVHSAIMKEVQEGPSWLRRELESINRNLSSIDVRLQKIEK